MEIAPFATEIFFARHEFSAPYLLCSSDCETLSVDELLALAGRDRAELGALRLGYTETLGEPALRAAVAARYDGVAVDDVVMLGAPEEGIYLLMRALLEPDDHVIVLTPAYDSLRNLAAHIARDVTPWPLRATPAGWALDLDGLAARLTPRTRLVVVNFPHNPTGFLADAASFDALLDLVHGHGCWLFSDEIYRGLEHPPAARLPSAAERYERAVVLSGLSKTYGLPGLRTGWLVMRDAALRDRLVNWKYYTTICAAGPSEFLATAALEVADALAARNQALVAEHLALAETFFGRWPDHFVWRRPSAGSVALVETPAVSATAFCERLLAEAGVLLLPGPALGAADRFVRMGFGRRNFAEALARLEAYLAASDAAPAA